MDKPIKLLKDKDLPRYILGLVRHRNSLWKMPDLLISLALSMLLFPWWLSDKWPDLLLSVLPNILGFTIGSFAIFLGVGSDTFRLAILGSAEEKSPYLRLSGLFVFSIVIQVVALIFGILAKGFYITATPVILDGYAFDTLQLIGSLISVFVFCWSIIITVRVAVRIFRVTRWYYAYLLSIAEQPLECCCACVEKRHCNCNSASPAEQHPSVPETATREDVSS